ncbi:MAG: NADH-quinone oxidoreductase subunit A [Anaerolineae bacterium]|jgi:NADH-quinone oxidoreductase subunit A|nr:NADH-quinone oxidoreductase subunit A [Anaerolineae bacterium]
MTLNEWIFVGLFLMAGWMLPVVPLLLGYWLAPRRPNPVKKQIYECGVQTVGSAWVQFRAQYYVFALVFVAFDVELVFLFPWALAYNKLGLFALFEMAVFILLLVVALVYTWRKGALEWS